MATKKVPTPRFKLSEEDLERRLDMLLELGPDELELFRKLSGELLEDYRREYPVRQVIVNTDYEDMEN